MTVTWIIALARWWTQYIHVLLTPDVLVSMDPPAQAISMTLASPTSFPHLLQINLLFTTTQNSGAARPWDARIHTSPAE